MKVAGFFIPVAAVALVFTNGLYAQDGAASDKPYSSIVSRNIFGLVPIPVVDPATLLPPPEPPPKITPNGIMTIFGRLQVLFKVAVKPPPGQPQKDASYVMNEGERQDEITVLKIDSKAGMVTFDNHGTVQELSLVPAASSAGPAGPAGGARMPMPAMNNPALRVPPAGGASVLPAIGAASSTGPGGRKVRTGGNVSQASSAATSVRGNSQPAQSAQPETLSPEAQIIMMESQRAKWLDQGNPAAAIIPPTPLTRDLIGEPGSGAGGPPVPGQ
ncbi:MAG: hypothetical protein WCH99_10600 [Verrucomicrobiota bacterium]